MLIRSQDKECIINFDNLKSVRIGGYNGDSIIVFTESEALEIGKYSTEEKAIKVLDMICQNYSIMKSCDCSMNGISKEFKDASKEFINEFSETIRSLYVCQMPQDEEVEV